MRRTTTRLARRLRRKHLVGAIVKEGGARLVSPDWERRPIFILGPPSSGSTWLGAIVAHLPDHVFYHENKLTDGRSGRALAASDRFARLVPRRLLHAGFEMILRAHLWTLDLHSADLAGRGELLEPENLGRFDPADPVRTSRGIDIVDTAGGHVFITRLLRRAYPNAVFLYLMRDPRDVIASLTLRKKFGHRRDWIGWTKGYMDFYAAFEQAETFDDILVVKYEDLLEDAVCEVTRIVDWAGLPSELGRLNATVERNDAANVRAAGAARGNLDAGRSGGWRDELTEEQIIQIDQMCGRLLDRWGYR